jgi:hypothetical protein
MAVVIACRWNFTTPLSKSLEGMNGFRTIILGVLLGLITAIILYRNLFRQWPWDETVSPKTLPVGNDKTEQPTLKVETTADMVRAGSVVSFESGSKQLDEIQERLDNLQTSLQALADKIGQSSSNNQPAKDESTSKAIDAIATQMEAALKNAREQVERRDQVNENLVATLSKSSIQRTLARFAQSLELCRAVSTKVAEGKTSGVDAMEFLLGDLESALTDNNVHCFNINTGDLVATLPAGSFTPIAAVDATSPEQSGTIKEARTAAYFIDEGEGQRRFIAPAKVIVYKVSN